MDNQKGPPNQRSFSIHLWLEVEGWRGHVTDGHGEHWFEDGQSLLEFIGERWRLNDGTIRLLLEVEAGCGQVSDGPGVHCFDDGESVLEFISDRLRLNHGVPLPELKGKP
ncbi:hypothetical protein [Bradyrhizobium sp. JYMT SZCCT0180]|uniref:hypothetical protein n=1 Tax=Bradyrhizobium sp. JYMT SZCCT0180 TaxID=2807666 RepID=UPI001BAD1CB5|nr:hypothetical protein [Bradyrhizobium sp. JYMT SZCCT0180]MBR1214635.1 hypothetical protein [Bradyrhizobium sp. JYMT SZCCT0180]